MSGKLLNVLMEDMQANGLNDSIFSFFSATVEQNAHRKGIKHRARIIRSILSASRFPSPWCHTWCTSRCEWTLDVGVVVEKAIIEATSATASIHTTSQPILITTTDDVASMKSTTD